MGPLCRARSTLSLFFSVRSLTWPVNLSLSVSYSLLSHLKLFPAVSIYFHLISSCLTSTFSMSCLISFLSSSSAVLSISVSLPLFASVCSFFYLFSLFLQQSVGEERTDLFKISKDRSGGLAGPSLSANSPSLLLTDKQKSEPAGLAAVFCLLSLLYPSLFSACGGVDC